VLPLITLNPRLSLSNPPKRLSEVPDTLNIDLIGYALENPRVSLRKVISDYLDRHDLVCRKIRLYLFNYYINYLIKHAIQKIFLQMVGWGVKNVVIQK
jgi:hypothetical protein